MTNFKGVQNVQPLTDFNWDKFENGAHIEAGKNDLTKAYDEAPNKIQEHQVVEGTVISVSKKEVVASIGYKSDGIIPTSEFRYNPELKTDDKVEAYVENQGDRCGQLILSHKKAHLRKSRESIDRALEDDKVIQGYIRNRTKDGMIINVFGIEAFLPGSQIDVYSIRNYDVFVDEAVEFKVVKINQGFRNVIVSHETLIETELEAQCREIISHLEKGQILESTIKNTASYGVFVDFGGVDGLVHITDPSRGRVSDSHEVIALDQKVNVVILDFGEKKKCIIFSLKQLTQHLWGSLDPNLEVGDHVKNKVVVMTDYGTFIEIQPDVESLIHASEINWSQHLRSAQEFMKVSDEVGVVILTLDRDEREMPLGTKQLKEDPWEAIEVKYPASSRHTAKVRNFTNFGIFVEFEEGVDGLIHISDLSWTKKVEHPSEFTSRGSEIEVVVLEIDKENRHLSLGHKQLGSNPWDEYETIYTPSSIHKGKITKSMDKGAVVTPSESDEGFATPKHLVRQDGTQAQLDEVLPFVVIELVKDTKRIILSHSCTFEEVKGESRRQRPASQSKPENDAAVINNVAASTSLGDLGVLADLKRKMKGGK